MNDAERKTLLRFVLLYMGMFFILFASLSIFYYLKQRETEREHLAHRMQLMLLNPAQTLPSGFDLTAVPRGRFPPWILVDQGDRLVLAAAPETGEKKVKALVAEGVIFEERIRTLQRRIAVFMILAFFINLPVAAVLGWVSLQPYRRANRKLREFAEDIIHDLNAPVTALGINLEALAEACPNKRLAFIKLSLKQIRSLYHNLELYLRDEYREDAEAIELSQTVGKFVEILEEQHPEVQFHIHLSPLRVTLNPLAFERIVSNLIHNAIKYGGTHPAITIGVDTHNHFYIQDNGPGLPESDAVLKRGRQANPRESGFGLGLDIVHKLAAECRLPLHIRSEPGRGTIFSFDLSDRIIP